MYGIPWNHLRIRYILTALQYVRYPLKSFTHKIHHYRPPVHTVSLEIIYAWDTCLPPFSTYGTPWNHLRIRYILTAFDGRGRVVFKRDRTALTIKEDQRRPQYYICLGCIRRMWSSTFELNLRKLILFITPCDLKSLYDCRLITTWTLWRGYLDKLRQTTMHYIGTMPVIYIIIGTCNGIIN
jgi:hypothetical protein